MKLCVMIPENEHHQEFKQVVDTVAVPEVGEIFGTQPEWSHANGERSLLMWVESRRWYLSRDGELWVDVWLTENVVVNTTTVDSCRRALRMEYGSR